MTPKAPLANCDQCPLKSEPCVRAYAPKDPKLIIIGEAPGYDEVQAGRPFVGVSGRLLAKTLAHAGVDPEEVYMTNAVLCRPPKNQLAEYPRAIVACQERLRAEIEPLPNVPIVLAGATALEAAQRVWGLAHQGGITQVHGKWRSGFMEDPNDTEGLAVIELSFMPVLHPAFVLRSPQYFQAFYYALKAALADRSVDWLDTKYTVLDSVPSVTLTLERFRQPYRSIAFDVETSNLHWYTTRSAEQAELLCFAFTDNIKHAYIIPGHLFADPDVQLAVTLLLRNTAPIAHNGKFDLNVLSKYHIKAELADDTMLAHFALDEQAGTHGLKQLASVYLGVPDYEAELIDKHFRGLDREARDYRVIPLRDLYKYCAIDVCATYALMPKLAKEMYRDNVSQPYSILINASNMLTRAEQHGFLIDRPYLEQVHAKLLKELKKAELAIQSEASKLAQQYLDTKPSTQWGHIRSIDWVKNVDQYRRVLDKIVAGVNLSSWQQVQVLLYDVLGLKHTKKLGFKTKPRSTNAEALDALPDHPFVSILQEYRRLEKIRSTYTEPILNTLTDEHDRLHINFKLHGTETYRLSAADSQHGIPRASDIWGQALRGAYIAPEGYKLVIADYSQAELRAFAAESQEPFLLEIFNDDRDPHGEMTKSLFPNDPVVAQAEYSKDDSAWHWEEQTKTIEARWKERRTIAKNVIFGGLIYMGGASGIAAMIPGGKVTEAQLKPILAAFKAKMQRSAQWQHEQFRKARDLGYVVSRFGNKRRTPLITDENLDEIKKAVVNAPIQNSASQLNLISATTLDRLGYQVLHLIHDSIILEVPDHRVEQAEQDVRAVMINTGTQYFPEVPWKVDIDVSQQWYPKRPLFDD